MGSSDYYPLNRDLTDFLAGSGMAGKVNFSLWHQKMVPWEKKTGSYGNVDLKAAGENNRKAVFLYRSVYDRYKSRADEGLKEVHKQQKELICNPLSGLVGVEIPAILKTSLVTGSGADHPAETSLFLDRNLGIPAIPASTIKGITRLGHILEWLDTQNDNIEPEVELNDIRDFPEIFGTAAEEAGKIHKGGRGQVVFLDAYPEKVPELQVDILNPHYQKYYGGEKDVWPSDDQNPVPVNFLTVAPGTVFIFRFLAPQSLSAQVEQAVRRVLTQEGAGAKTALGYGRFEIRRTDEFNPQKILEQKKQTLLNNLKKRKDFPSENIDALVEELKTHEELWQDKEIEKKCREWFKPFPTKGSKKRKKVNARYIALAAVFNWKIPGDTK